MMENNSNIERTPISPLSVEDLKASRAKLEEMLHSFSQDPALPNEAKDIQKMMDNLDRRIGGLQN